MIKGVLAIVGILAAGSVQAGDAYLSFDSGFNLAAVAEGRLQAR